MNLTFEVIGPEETVSESTPKPNGGGAQTKRAVNLTLTSNGDSSTHTFDSIYAACKFAEVFNSRSNIAKKIKEKGSYKIERNGRVMVFA